MKENFRQHPDGTWEAIKRMVVSKPNGSTLVVAPGTKFITGVSYLGFDIGGVLEGKREYP